MRDANQKFEVTILNWDKYQREMKGGENRKRRREWIALSVDLFSDPDYLAMDQLHRNAWVGMLCHAGKVGPVYELCPSDARLLFRLRRSPDFQVFKNQGFIDLRTATNKTNNTRQTIQTKTCLPEWLELGSWREFVEYRKERGNPLSDRAVKLSLAKLEGLSAEDQRKTIEKSIERNWTGLFPEKSEVSRYREL